MHIASGSETEARDFHDRKSVEPIPVFHAIRSIRGFEEVAEQIESAILSGRLRTGERLPNEHELAAVFRVSRTTLREAIRALEASGIVEVKRGANGGIFVTEPGVGQVVKALGSLIRFRGATARDLGEFREGFEAETAHRAAERAAEPDIVRLSGLADQYEAAAKNAAVSWEELVVLDLAFHESVAIASGNEIRHAVTLAIQGALKEASLFLAPQAREGQFRAREAKELRAIARAISRRDGALARSTMRRHVKWNAALEERASA